MATLLHYFNEAVIEVGSSLGIGLTVPSLVVHVVMSVGPKVFKEILRVAAQSPGYGCLNSKHYYAAVDVIHGRQFRYGT